MAGVGFLQSLWEKPIWEGVWPCLDPMDSVCVFTHSIRGVECASEVRAAWRALFLPDAERAGKMWVNESFSPFFAAAIRTPYFSADVLKKCAYRPALTRGRRKRRRK